MGRLWWLSSKENACDAGTAGDAGLIPGSGRFPGGSDSKEPACNAGDLGSIPGLGRSLEKGTATHSSGIANSQT